MRSGELTRIAGLICLATVFGFGSPALAWDVRSGHYVGNDVAGRAITGVGFQPDFVLMKADVSVSPVARTSTMVGDATKTLNSSASLETGLIESLDPDGFTVGNSGRVNSLGEDVYWVAFKGPGIKVSSYIGDGQDNRAITGLGFDPAVVIEIPDTTETAIFRTSVVPTENCPSFSNLRGTNRLQRMLPDGFEVGTDPKVNAVGVSYHYVAFPAVPGNIAVGSYTGDGNNGRAIDIGFSPEYVLARIDADSRGVHRMASVAGDATLFLSSDPSGPGVIEAFTSSGFDVGSSADINGLGSTYFWMAFARNDAAWADAGINLQDAGINIQQTIGGESLHVGCDCGSVSGSVLSLGTLFALGLLARRRT